MYQPVGQFVVMTLIGVDPELKTGQALGDQAVHTASDTPISPCSTGSSAWRKFGVQKNTDIFFKLLEAVAGEGKD